MYLSRANNPSWNQVIAKAAYIDIKTLAALEIAIKYEKDREGMQQDRITKMAKLNFLLASFSSFFPLKLVNSQPRPLLWNQ